MFSMFRAFFLKADEQKPKRLMQKPLLERSYVEKCCRNHGNRYIELPKAITWFDGEVESCCFFRSHILVCIVLQADSCSKSLRARPKRSRARTSDHRICCQNLSRHRFWKAEIVLERQSFTCFLILPDEFIEQSSKTYKMDSSNFMDDTR